MLSIVNLNFQARVQPLQLISGPNSQTPREKYITAVIKVCRLTLVSISQIDNLVRFNVTIIRLVLGLGVYFRISFGIWLGSFLLSGNCLILVFI